MLRLKRARMLKRLYFIGALVKRTFEPETGDHYVSLIR